MLRGCPPDPSFPWARCATCSAPLDADGWRCTGYPSHPRETFQIRLYATWTGTKRNVAAMHAGGVRLLTGPDQLDLYGRHRLPPLGWALDNGAWGCFQRGEPFNADRFERALERWGARANWIALPDIVAGGLASLDLSLSWIDRLRSYRTTLLIPVQDGMEPGDVEPHLDPERVGIFVGGSTAWKLRTLRAWGALAERVGVRMHVGRVNSAKRVRLCIEAGAESCDGTSLSRFAVNAPLLVNASRTERQMGLFVEECV